MPLDVNQFEQLAIQITPPTLVAGGGTGLAGLLSGSHALGLVGLLISLGGLLVNWYYNYKRHQREQREDMRKQIEHERRMRRMRTHPGELK